MMLFNGLYTQRRVPREKDGRTNEEKEKPEYREPYSLWYEIDEEKMYTEARGLKDAGFDCQRFVYGVLMRGMFCGWLENATYNTKSHVLLTFYSKI